MSLIKLRRQISGVKETREPGHYISPLDYITNCGHTSNSTMQAPFPSAPFAGLNTARPTRSRQVALQRAVRAGRRRLLRLRAGLVGSELRLACGAQRGGAYASQPRASGCARQDISLIILDVAPATTVASLSERGAGCSVIGGFTWRVWKRLLYIECFIGRRGRRYRQ